MVIDMAIAAPIGGALLAGMGLLWRQIIELNKTIRQIEKEKLEMVLKEAESSKQIALAFITGDGKIDSINEKLDTTNKLITELKK